MKIFSALIFSVLSPLAVNALGATPEDTLKTDSTIAVVDTTCLPVAVDTMQRVLQRNRQINAVLGYAKTFIGTNYRYGGTSPKGFDCSGLIYYSMKNFGIDIKRTSYGMVHEGKTVLLDELQPGDLLFFKGRNLNSSKVAHVAIVAEVSEDAIMMLHAASRGVVIDNFKESSYYVPRFLTAKRVAYSKEK